MTKQEVMTQLEAWGNEKMKDLNARHGAGEDQFGVNLSQLRGLAKQIKTDQELGWELWKTGNVEARLLATLIMKPKQFTVDQLDEMLRGLSYFKTVDWLMTHLVKNHPEKDKLREKWLGESGEYVGRAAWSLMAEKVVKEKGAGLNLPEVLDRIEAEMADEPMRKQETMNYTLAEIGINFPEHRERAIKIGEKLKVFIDYPVAKGCISPYAPIWITEMLKRKEE